MIACLTLPVVVAVGSAELSIRRATPADLHALVGLLADDPISAGRGDTADSNYDGAYASALRRIIEDPSNDLVVAQGATGGVVGMMQLTSIPGMARRGSTRLLLEAVRVASSERSLGIGTALMEWAIEQAAAELDAPLVQLTSDATRVDAHRFYRRLGFIDSHVGFKFHVTSPR